MLHKTLQFLFYVEIKLTDIWYEKMKNVIKSGPYG